MKKFFLTVKEMIFNRVVRNILTLFIFLFTTEILVRALTNVENTYAIVRIGISSLIISLIWNLFTCYFKKTIRKILNIIFSFIVSFYTFVEVGLYNYIGVYMGIANGEQGLKTVDYISDFIKSINISYYIIFIPFILYLFYILFIDKKLLKFEAIKKSKYIGIKKIIPATSIFFLICSFSYIYYVTLVIPFMQNSLQTINNKSLFKLPENPNLSVSQFGVLVYGLTDLNSQIFNIKADEYIYSENKNNEEVKITDYSRTFDDTSWLQLIDNETNSTMNNLNKYFINRSITEKNDYTGIFKDKNLIVILMESVDEIALLEQYFPTISKIYNEGISFRNNYSPRNSCSTGNNEMTVMTSLFSINNSCTANRYKNNKYFEAIFNEFNKMGYKTTSYHSYTDQYYARHTIHPNMGSSKFYGVNDLHMEYNGEVYEEWPSDLYFFETAMPYFVNEDKFMVFMSTVTTHQTYNVPSEMGDKYLDLFKDTNYSTTVKRYLSKMTELDKALEYMLKELENKGKLEDTVIALFADHYPYGLTRSQINTVLDYDVNVRQEVDRTPMVIYNAGRKAEQITKYTTLIDLLPTLLNMFDADYDPRLYLGTDIMSSNVGRAVFSDGSWQDAVGFYKATTAKFTPTNEDGNTYSNEELVSINQEISLRQKMSALAIQNNYFNYLEKGLNKYKVISNTTEESE